MAKKTRARDARSQRAGSDASVLLPPFELSGALQADSFDEEALTIDLLVYTGARVLRFDFWNDELFELSFSLDPEAVDLTRLNSGRTPLVAAHRSWSLEGAVGSIVAGSARVEPGVGLVSTARLSRVPSLEELRQKLAEGTIQNVSMGVWNYQTKDLTEKGDQRTHLQSIDWEPYEVSLVPVGADPGAHRLAARGDERAPELRPCLLRDPKTRTLVAMAKMTKRDERSDGGSVPEPSKKDQNPSKGSGEAAVLELEPGPQATRGEVEEREASPATETSPDPASEQLEVDERVRKALAAERARETAIRRAVRAARLEESVADELVARGVSLAAAREAVLDRLAERSDADAATSIHGSLPQTPGLAVTRGAADKACDAVLGAMRARYDLHPVDEIPARNGFKRLKVAEKPWEAPPEAEDLRFASTMDLARAVLEARGVRCTGLGKDAIARLALGGSVVRQELSYGAYHGTSDFAQIVANVANNQMLERYAIAPSNWRMIAVQKNAPDFKTLYLSKLGSAPRLEEVPPDAQYDRGTIVPGQENWSIRTYGKVFAMNRQLMINDQLDAFMDLFAKFGEQASVLENTIMWGLVESNVVMGDGVALFDAAHGNVTTGVISLTSLSAARTLLRRQTEPGGEQMNLMPAYFIVPPELETIAQQFTAQITPHQPSEANPFGQRSVFRAVVPESYLSDTLQWYVTTDPSSMPALVYSMLEGSTGPTITTRPGFDVDGLEIKCSHDFGGMVPDHRPWIRSTGAP